jgi:integration host factor subunit alpha
MSKRTIIRATLRDAIYDALGGVTREDAARFVEAVLEEIADTLVRGETVNLQGFGRFEVRARKARIGRNPKTMKPAIISARTVVAFRPSAVFVKRLNRFASTTDADA